MDAMQTIRLGTRSSRLAVAQSGLIKAALEKHYPNLAVELVCVDTRGDHDLRTPLTQVNDPDFFSAELDRTLIAGEVDFCVHSYKDLARNRPPEITTAAIPVREQPHDVIIFRGDILQHLQAGNSLRIGTCSLRREFNIRDFLADALPLKSAPEIKPEPLRGPVDERINRILPEAGETRLDAVVLALAGLNRLWTYPPGQQAIAKAVQTARLMVLPLSKCPAAPGQGALAIECRTDDTRTRKLLAPLHDQQTAELVMHEQALLDEYAADNPAGIGVSAVSNPELGFVARIRGRNPVDNSTIELTRSGKTYAKPERGNAWDDSNWRLAPHTEMLAAELPARGALFVAHWRALENHTLNAPLHCWTSGLTSWKKLAAQGIWVEGCADDLGFASVEPLLRSPFLNLPPLSDWTALTHADATDSWAGSGVGTILATYKSHPQTAADAPPLSGCTHFYWSSARQFESLRDKLPERAIHACGTGKTLQQLRGVGLQQIRAFTSRREWLQWLG